MRVTASNLANAISRLPRDVEYDYINERNSGRIVVHSVQLPEGPVLIKRYQPEKGEAVEEKKVESISTQMLWRMANSLVPGKPVHIDRIFGGSYNTRSVLESLLAHTPQFYSCRPGRIEVLNRNSKVKPGHKHLIYLPDQPHENGVIGFKEVDIQISEITVDAVYEGMNLEAAEPDREMTIEQSRRHAQIQIALVMIGKQLGFRTWVAQNDRSIEYAGKRIAEYETVIDSLSSEQVLSAYPDAVDAAKLIDCIWFRNGRLMPAVMEVEHSTGVTSGLTRMKGFYDLGPPLRDIRWTIVAPDDDRKKVLDQANREQFRDLNVKLFPYSAVEELYSLCSRRNIHGVEDQFLDCFMEDCVTTH